MKYKQNWIFYILFFIISCNEKSDNTIITNPNAPEISDETIYTFDLSSDSGQNLENVTIFWADTEESMQITEEGSSSNHNTSENLYNFSGMTPGEFQDILLEITVGDSTYSDKIQIFTRSVYPVTNFTCAVNTIVEYDDRYDDGEFFYDYLPGGGNGMYDNNGEYKERFIEGNNIYNGGNNCICNNNSIPDGCTECYIDNVNNKYDEDDESIIENEQFDDDDNCICINDSIPDGCTECYYDTVNNQYDTEENHIDCGIDSQGDSICENDANWEASFGNNTYDGDDNCICMNNTAPNGCTECYYDTVNNQFDIGEDFKEDGAYSGGDSCMCSNNDSIPSGCTECYIDSLNENYDSDDNEVFIEINEIFDGANNCICNNNSIPDGCTECYYDANGTYDGNDNCICTNNELPNGCTECYIDGIPVYHRHLQWSPSIEPQESFQKYSIYRAYTNDKDELIDPDNCNNCEIIETTELQTSSSYIDSTESVLTFPNLDDFFYLVQVSTGSYTQNSYIQPAYLFNSEQITLNASTDQDTYIEVDWIGQTITSNYFYQYEIQRASDIAGNTIEKNMIIPKANIDHYIDRNVGDGTTKFYRIIVTYIDGTSSQPSEFVSGYSIP
tara:strand:- start:6012 stop:7856 length:1845 start_codon:yes stop_codon:yes gene_type:complete